MYRTQELFTQNYRLIDSGGDCRRSGQRPSGGGLFWFQDHPLPPMEPHIDRGRRGVTPGANLTSVQPHHFVAKRAHLRQVMGNKQDGERRSRENYESPSNTFVENRHHLPPGFIKEQDIGFYGGGHRKPQAGDHPGRKGA